MGVSIVLLAYKEAENLRVLLPQIIEQIELVEKDYEILVIDTKEPLDDTKDVCEQYGARYINQEQPAFAGAFRTGIKYATKERFLILDSDGSHNPVYIPELYQMHATGTYNVVIGSRYIKGGKTQDAKSSIIMSHILNTCFRICLGLKAKDLSTDYRIYYTEQLKSVELQCQNYDVLEEVLLKIKLQQKNFAIGEVPIEFHKRIYGESKRRLVPFILSYMKTLVRLTWMRITKK